MSCICCQHALPTVVSSCSPCGKKFRSKPQIARFLGECADLSAFDFSRAGTPGDGTQRRRARDRSSSKKVEVLRSLPLARPLSSNPLRPSGPIRRTCGVIKLPVTYIRAPSPSEEDGKERANSPEACAKEIEPEIPKTSPLSLPVTTSSSVAVPALWENRLLGVKACDYETGDDIVPPPKTQNGTTSVTEALTKPLPKQPVSGSLTANLNRVSTIKSPPPLTSSGSLATSLLAQQLQQSLKQAVSLSSGSSVIPSLLQRTGKLTSSQTNLKNGQSKESHVAKDNVLVSLGNKNPIPSANTGGSIVRVEGKQVLESLSRMVTDTDLRLQEERVRQLRQQLLAAERK